MKMLYCNDHVNKDAGMSLPLSVITLNAQLAYVQLGNVAGAVAFLRSGLQRPLFPFPRSNLQMEIARTQWRAGEQGAVKETLVQFLRENPGYTPAVTWLLSLQKR
ncbi:MAG: hypothetical protein ACYCR3_09360 [Acidithiobacillus sp.]